MFQLLHSIELLFTLLQTIVFIFNRAMYRDMFYNPVIPLCKEWYRPLLWNALRVLSMMYGSET